MLKPRFNNDEQISLCEALDRVLHKGAVVHGDVTISVAGVDLIYLRLQLVLASVESILTRELPVKIDG